MDNKKQECTALKVLSGIVMAIFLIAGLLLIFITGSFYARFFNRFAIIFKTEHWMLPSAVSTIVLKSVGASLLSWAFLLYKLIQDPIKNAVVSAGAGVLFLLLAVVTVTHFFSREIVSVIPPFIIALRVLVTGSLGLLFLILTPKQ